jgi:hypothetical protein
MRVRTLTTGLSHMYDDAFPEYKQMNVMIRETLQQMNEKIATKRVRLVDGR